MDTKVCFFCLLLFVLLSCNNQNRSQNDKRDGNAIKKIEIDFKKAKELPVSDIYESIELIPLEKTKDCLIGGVHKLITWDQKFYLMSGETIFIFDSAGHFLNKIAKSGNGYGEYYSMDDFEINPFTNNIEILSAFGFIYEYDLDGKFIQKFDIPLRAVHHLKDISKSVVALYSESEDQHINIFNKDSNAIVLQTFTVPENIQRTPLHNGATPFDSYDGNVLFFQGFLNDVYLLKETGLKVKYTLDFGPNNVDLNSLPETKDLNKLVNFMFESDKVNSYVRILENEKYIYAMVLKGRLIYHIIYNKSNETYFVFERFKNNIQPQVIDAFYQEGVIANVYAHKISQYITPEVVDEKNREILKNIKIDDNPVIIYYKFKPELTDLANK